MGKLGNWKKLALPELGKLGITGRTVKTGNNWGNCENWKNLRCQNYRHKYKETQRQPYHGILAVWDSEPITLYSYKIMNLAIPSRAAEP